MAAVRIEAAAAGVDLRVMGFRFWLPLAFVVPCLAQAQFVRAKPGDHVRDPSVFVEDPFIVKYRREFFSVFRGDFPRFEKAYAEIAEMAKKDPKDARALVWLGNGHTVKSGLLMALGQAEEANRLLLESRVVLDRAVSLSPDDPNIFMMRAVTLYIQGQHLPDEKVPRKLWETLRDDCEHLIRLLGDRMSQMSIHVRGETYGELGVAYLKLGEKAKAKTAFEKILVLCPGTDYEVRARKELADLNG